MNPLAVVIVNFNTRDHLCACLRTVVGVGAPIVVVVDNGSSDGSVDRVRNEFPSVIVDVDWSNPGYGAAANRGIRRCGSADVLLLNSDTRLQPGALHRLRAYLDDHPSAGIVGPRLLNVDNSLQRSCFPFPSPVSQHWKHNSLASIVRHIPGLRQWYLKTWMHDTARTVPWVLGAALVIRREAFDEVEGFDESFFMYFEEIDLCYRLRQRRWETHFAPVTEVVHEGCASTSQFRAAMLAQYCGSLMAFYQRHYSGPMLSIAEIVMKVSMAGRLLRDGARYALVRDAGRRHELAENVKIWSGAIVGTFGNRSSV